MRIITQGGIKYLCLRPDVIPGLKPSSIVFIRKSLSDSSLGIRSDRRDFLETPPKPGETIEKVTPICFICMHLILLYNNVYDWLYKNLPCSHANLDLFSEL